MKYVLIRISGSTIRLVLFDATMRFWHLWTLWFMELPYLDRLILMLFSIRVSIGKGIQNHIGANKLVLCNNFGMVHSLV